MDISKEQFAFEFNTLPKYVFKDSNGAWRNFEYESFIYPERVGQEPSSQVAIDPRRLYELANEGALEPLQLEGPDSIFLYVLINRSFHKFINDTRQDFFIIASILNMDEETTNWVSALWEDIQIDYNSLIAGLENEKAQFRAEFSARAEAEKAFQTAIAFTVGKSTVDSVSEVYEFTKDASLLDLFNTIQVTSELPLLSTRDYYKVLDKFPFAVEFPTLDNIMFVYVNGARLVVESVGSRISPRFRVTVPKTSATPLVVFRRAVSADRFNLLEVRQNSHLILSAPQPFDFNQSIWADLVATHPIISNYFVINESSRITTRMTVNMFWLKSATDRVAFSLSETTEIDLKRATRRVAAIRLKIQNVEQKSDDEQELAELVARALGIYIVEAPNIVRVYNQYLTTPIRLVPRVDENSKVRLKNIAGNMFLPQFTRKCQFLPEIVNDDEARALAADGFQVIEFPKTPSEGDQFKFSCAQHEDHVYPGLLVNNMTNREQFPYLPCCYKQDQTLKQQSNYNSYYNDEPVRERRGGVGGGRRIITDKIARFGQEANLPPKIEKLFVMLDAGRPARIGGDLSPSSIIGALLAALDPSFRALNSDARRQRLRSERARLAALPDTDLLVCRQECWNISLGMMRDILRNETEFLDPARFYSLLEAQFQCRIILFDRASYAAPKFAGYFLRSISSAPIVCVYQNMGSEADRSVFPQCERIVASSESFERIFELYNKSFKPLTVGLTGALRDVQAFPPSGLRDAQPIAQHFDIYGRAFALNIRLDGDLITFFLTYPQAPFRVPLARDLYWAKRRQRLFLNIEGSGVMGGELREEEPSLMNEFLQARFQSILLIENAKHLYSAGKTISVSRPTELNRDRWASAVSVRSEDIIKKLEFVVDLFRKKHAVEFAEYKDYRVISKYNQVSDFTAQAGAVISRTIDIVHWEDLSPVVQSMPLVGKSFFIELNGKIYLCAPSDATQVRDSAFVYLWNTKTFAQTRQAGGSAMLYVENGKIYYYRALMVSATQ